MEAKLNTVQLENHDGKFVEPTADTFRASAAGADWKNAPGFYLILTDQPGEKSWPITGVTYILLRKESKSPEQQAALLRYFDWCFTAGAPAAAKLNYVGIPPEVVELIRATWQRELR